MNRSSATIIATVAFVLLTLATGLQAALQGIVPADGQVVHILVGKSVIINVQTPLTRVMASNPAVIETTAISPTQLVVGAKGAGKSSLILWDESGRSQMLDVIVDIDMVGLRTAIQRAYPNQRIEVQGDADRVILSGSVSNPKVAEDVRKMASLYSTQIVDSMVVPVVRERQVLLEVKFAEVDRTQVDQFGINILSTGITNTIGTISTQQFGPPAGGEGSSSGNIIEGTGFLRGITGSLSVTDLLNVFLFRPDINLAATIKALQQKAVLQILAEPSLLALSGQKASFLAGGQFPFPVVQGGANIGAVTIQFRNFGVQLDFTGTISPDNTIRLHVAPEVSTLDFTNSVSISGFTIPAISTRRAETEIELKDGQSFGIAGLIDHRAQVQMSKIPGIGDIPILGQLFRSKNTNRSNTELMVIVTPRIVDPVQGAPAPVMPRPAVPFLENPKFDGKPSSDLPPSLSPPTR